MKKRTTKKTRLLSATCTLCGNNSNFDKDSLKASTVKINGCDVIMCCYCEDEMLGKLLQRRIPEKKMKELLEPLMSDERNDIIDLYHLCDDDED